MRYFVQQYARRMNRRITSIPTESMNALARYHWPGNIRELQNFIERAVILSTGSTLQVPVRELKRGPVGGAASSPWKPPSGRPSSAPCTTPEARSAETAAPPPNSG